MSESVNETNNATTTTSVHTEESFKSKLWKYTKLTSTVVGGVVAIAGIAAVTTYGMMKVFQGECSVDIG